MSCPNCNAPMAVDQRYCLNCGVRGGPERLAFLEILRAQPETELVPYGRPLPATRTTTVTSIPPAPAGFQEQLRVNSGLIAGVGVLLLAMLVGVLIGSAGGDEPVAAAAPPPQVISVGGVGAAAPVAAAAATGPTGEDQATDTTVTAADSSSSSSPASKPAKAEKPSKAPVKATSSAVKELDKLTGAAREKAVEKLGKNIATGGKAPKKDTKPAAAGGGFEEIG